MGKHYKPLFSSNKPEPKHAFRFEPVYDGSDEDITEIVNRYLDDEDYEAITIHPAVDKIKAMADKLESMSKILSDADIRKEKRETLKELKQYKKSGLGLRGEHGHISD